MTDVEGFLARNKLVYELVKDGSCGVRPVVGAWFVRPEYATMTTDQAAMSAYFGDTMEVCLKVAERETLAAIFDMEEAEASVNIEELKAAALADWAGGNQYRVLRA